MRLLALILLLFPVWLVPAPMACAQETALTRAQYIARIRPRLNATRQLWNDGRRDAAMRSARLIDAEMNGYAAFMDGDPAFWWPDLEIARFAIVLRDHETVETYAGPVVGALDTEATRGTPERIEAMLILARSLNLRKQYGEAEVLLRGLLRDRGAGVRPQLVLEAETLLSAVATSTAAPDAEILRADLLASYLDREGASVRNYLFLWRRDLEARRLARADRKRLAEDARRLLDFLRADPRVPGLETDRLMGELARVFMDAGDFARAAPILAERLETLARERPQSGDYYWAVENLMGLQARQNRFAANLGIGARSLDELDGRPDSFARVTAAIANQLGFSLKKTGNAAGAQEMYRRAYAEVRRVVSANDPKARSYRRRLDLSMIDPETYPLAEELGLTRQAGQAPAAHGSDVLRRFWAGDYVLVADRLARLDRDPSQDRAVIRLNAALFHALMGEVGPALEAVEAARRQVAETAGGEVAADTAWFDIFAAMANVFARDRDAAAAGRALDRLEARPPASLTADQRAMLPILRSLQAMLAEDNIAARDSFRAAYQGHDPLADTSPWGLTVSLAILGIATDHLLPDELATLHRRTAEAAAAAGSPRLLSALVEVFFLNAQVGATASERRFQELAFHLRTLSRTLPPEHQWQAVARLNFAIGLRERGLGEEALALMHDIVAKYRASPWHEADVLAQLRLEQAVVTWELGRIQTAEALASEVYRSMDIDAYRSRYWMPILVTYAATLSRSGRPQAALAALQTALARPDRLARLVPVDLAQLYQFAAGLHGLLGDGDAQIAMLERAVQVLPAAGYRRGLPLSAVLHDAANARFGRGEYAAAWEAMTRSNAMWFDAQAAVAAEGGSDLVRNRQHDHDRIVTEAVLGWVMVREARK